MFERSVRSLTAYERLVISMLDVFNPLHGMIDTVTLHSQSYRVLQPPALTDLYASKPSLHFGWDFLVGIAIARHAQMFAGRLFGMILPIAMFSAIVLTGNRYVVDGVAGGSFALTALAISRYVTPHWSRTLIHISLRRLWRSFHAASAQGGAS